MDQNEKRKQDAQNLEISVDIPQEMPMRRPYKDNHITQVVVNEISPPPAMNQEIEAKQNQ